MEAADCISLLLLASQETLSIEGFTVWKLSYSCSPSKCATQIG